MNQLLSNVTTDFSSIVELSLLGDDPNARLVNCKKWLRMMKRRVRKELEKAKSADFDPQEMLAGLQALLDEASRYIDGLQVAA